MTDSIVTAFNCNCNSTQFYICVGSHLEGLYHSREN